MSVKKFKFVSPGVFINEIDNSQLPATPDPVGPMIIGRTRRGPGFQPVRVRGFSDFIDVFGNPVPGPTGGDVWRENTLQAPTYAAYAAQAWLKNNSPCTIMRVLGDQSANATSAGKAGWKVGAVATVAASTGGAYGLFLFNSSSNDLTSIYDKPGTQTGCLAATWYFTGGGIQLSGATARDGYDMASGDFAKSGSGVVYPSVTQATQFQALVKDSTGANVEKVTFNFSQTSQNYIRKVFNTNPTLTNSSLVSSDAASKPYWLGSTYERYIADTVTGSVAGSVFGVILPMDDGTNAGSDFNFSSRSAQTGWFISQDLRTTSGSATVSTDNVLDPIYSGIDTNVITKLFKLHTLNSGEWEQRNLKISIQDIKASTNTEDSYGKFTVVLRKMEDSDNAVQVVERFSNCSLNPNSLDYIARKIGDMYTVYDATKRRLIEYGNYANNSKFVRIEMNTSVDAGMSDPELLPFGTQGPIRFKGFAIGSGGTAQPSGYIYDPEDMTALVTNRMVKKGSDGYQGIVQAMGGAGVESILAGTGQLTASITFPAFALRASASDGNLSDPTEAYFGVDTSQAGSSTTFEKSNYDLARPLPASIANFAAQTTSPQTELSFVFSLDDISGTAGGQYSHQSGSRASGVSITAASGSYKKILDAGFDRFTAVLAGGFDGFDITEREPLNMSRALPSTATEENSYAFYSVKKAMDIVSDPEFVEYNIATAPGITNEGLTSHLINICEDRADALAIIDPRGGYIPSSEDSTTEQTRIATVTDVINNMRDRGMNSSYGCAYYPWVRVRDTIQGASFWAPPSVVALGVIGSSERKTAPWFAPAGFNRGGLTEGAAGIPVVGVRVKLTSDDRDKLYDASINPIASFPAEGIVVFGQKTLQITPSALDRVNVRRLLIYLKKEISKIAARILFDQNVKATWTRFENKVVPLLSSVQAGYGLTEYKVVLDETTTTSDLIDRNILYAKIFLKPARAIEYIAIDFNISRTGASFED